jgi:hypothetical protein
MDHEVSSAIERRRSGLARVRAVTSLTLAAGLVLTGAFAALAARSTHVVRHVVQRAAPTHRAHASPSAGAVVAPPPPLVSIASPSAQASPPPAPTQAPAPAPSAATTPPVAVSGGS